MAGRSSPGGSFEARRSIRTSDFAFCTRSAGRSGALLSGNGPFEKLQGELCVRSGFCMAGFAVFHAAPADVRLRFSCSIADRSGVVPKGSDLADLDIAGAVPAVGEYARIVHRRNRSPGSLPLLRAEIVSVRKRPGHCLERKAADPIGVGAAPLAGGTAHHAVRHAVSRLSLGYHVLPARQFDIDTGVAANAV